MSLRDKTRTIYVLMSKLLKNPGGARMYLAHAVPTPNPDSIYWNDPKLTNFPFRASYFDQIGKAYDFVAYVDLAERFKPVAIDFVVRECFESDQHPDFVAMLREATEIADSVIADRDNLGAEDVSRAGLAMSKLTLLLDFYKDWQVGKVPYSFDDEIRVMTLIAKLAWKPLKNIFMVQTMVDRIRGKYSSRGIGYSCEDIWFGAVGVSQEERTKSLEAFQTQVIAKRTPR